MPQTREQLMPLDDKVKVPKRVMQAIYVDLSTVLEQRKLWIAMGLLKLWLSEEKS